jgi:hypothetical protein
MIVSRGVMLDHPLQAENETSISVIRNGIPHLGPITVPALLREATVLQVTRYIQLRAVFR